MLVANDFVTYIGGDAYSAPIILKSDGTTQNYLYLHRDYQGSILAITNDTGQTVEKRLFDAWGNIALVQDGLGNNLGVLTLIDRGYTGHEHLQSVGLIHMNGRLYDPKLHRFLQPDNYVQEPFNTQNYNRYGYCWNNPLKYTDPSGESGLRTFIQLIVIAAGVILAAFTLFGAIAIPIIIGQTALGTVGAVIAFGAYVYVVYKVYNFLDNNVYSFIDKNFPSDVKSINNKPINFYNLDYTNLKRIESSNLKNFLNKNVSTSESLKLTK